MNDEFETIKRAAKEPYWLRYGQSWVNSLIAVEFGLPDVSVMAGIMPTGKQTWEARFSGSKGALSHVAPEYGMTRADATARLILAAKDYLAREARARTVGA